VRTYTVYKGEVAGKIVYIGTTVQKPSLRFNWHRANGKNFKFTVLSTHDSPEAMLEEELRLIKLYNPCFNKRRKQNLNVPLTSEQLDARKGDSHWCQCCLKRHVNSGYSCCYYCSRI
jgi:hypothetical protein